MMEEQRVAGSTGAGQNDVVWRPTPNYIQGSHLARFMAAQHIPSLDALRARSVADVAWFWDAVVHDLDLEFFEPYHQVLDLSRGVPWARWFVGGSYNYVHNALDRHAAGPSSQRFAVVWEGEDGEVRRLTYAELADETNRLAAALRQIGIAAGDRVGIFLPMLPEVVTAMLACGKIGAIFTPIFSGYAAPAVASRLQDSGARLLITADGFLRRGRVVPMGATAIEAARQSPSVEKVLMRRRLGTPLPSADPSIVDWDDLIATSIGTDRSTLRTDADDPFMIIYTSGTTGRPKGTVHVHGGFPIKATQDLAHCFDLRSSDVLFWLTDLGWMMGPWAIAGGLTLGSTLLLYEGAIDYPQPDRLWELVEKHRITTLGISPTAVRALMPQGDTWVTGHDRSTLRVLGSTGEPWNPAPWQWLFEVVGESRCPIVNYSGGTEISGGIVGGSTLDPLRPCAFAGPVPGMDADVVDENGSPVRGTVGELIIRQPWVGMTRGFWGTPERYLETYWSRWPNVWVHGDWAMIDENASWYILGRSDDTIKLAGKRVGPAEVESAAVAHPAVREAAAIGIPDPVKGEALVVLAILRPGTKETEQIRAEIQNSITDHLGKALHAERVCFLDDLPRTRNAKILRRVIRAAYLGQDELGDLTSLENPAAVEAVRQAR